MSPALFSLLKGTPADFTHLKVLTLGGEPLPKTAITLWADRVRVLNAYGTTEGTVYQTCADISAAFARGLDVSALRSRAGYPIASAIVGLDMAASERPGLGEVYVGGVSRGLRRRGCVVCGQLTCHWACSFLSLLLRCYPLAAPPGVIDPALLRVPPASAAGRATLCGCSCSMPRLLAAAKKMPERDPADVS